MDSDLSLIAIAAAFVVIVGRFAYGWLKYGSWTGARLKGRIERTVGEVDFSGDDDRSRTMEVHIMQGDESNVPFVGLVIHGGSLRRASIQTYRLSGDQARELTTYLNQAAQNA